MWHKSLTLLFSILLLIACTPTLPIPTALVAMPAETPPGSTQVVNQTESATPIPTETVVPTPTEVNLENAPYNVPVHIDLKDANGNEIVKGEFASHVDGKPYGLLKNDDPNLPQNLIPINFYCQTGVTCPYFHEVQRPGTIYSMTGTLEYQLGTRYLNDFYNGKAPVGYAPYENVNKMRDGGVPIQFTTSEGDFTYYPSPTHGYNVFYVPWEDTVNDKAFKQYDHVSASWRIKKAVDSFGNAVSVIAVNKDLSGLDPDLISTYSFEPLEQIIKNIPETMDYITQSIKFHLGDLGHLAYDPSGSPIYGIDVTP